SQSALPANLGGDFRYHGQWKERATGLYYVRARTYDAVSGRFLSRDPVEGAELEPETFHPYGWNAGNPWVYRDPTGEFTLIGLSAANNVQGNLTQVARSALVQAFKEKVREEVQGVAGDLLLGFFKSLLPADPTALGSFVTSFGNSPEKGIIFENALLDQVCTAFGIPDSIRENARAFGRVSRPPRQLTHSDLEIPSGFGRYAARLTSMPRLSARFSAGVIQSSASCGRTSL
ncbi:MAG: RHS repeat-associated core domain-containing protein, partial [Chromatiaceae bacterium]|nr:RHS repeat-associated core domain-containing protein [Chromatiaceae bacterium]